LIAAGVVRAIELDINPDWVAGYLYVHHAAARSRIRSCQASSASPAAAGPDTRDFLTVVAR